MGWKIIEIVPGTSFKAVVRKNTAAEYLVTVIVIILLFGFLFYQIRELVKEKNREVQDYENILLATATETYKVIRLLDLETGNSDYICFENDIVMRLGGDEYAVFADGITDQKTAVTIIERFLEAIDNIAIPELGDRKITVSVGIAFKVSGDGSDFEKLYSHADHCAYESKKIDGNAYMFYDLT